MPAQKPYMWSPLVSSGARFVPCSDRTRIRERTTLPAPRPTEYGTQRFTPASTQRPLIRTC